MSFIYEKLTEQDWEKYPDISLEELTGWYIDKERDVSIWMTTGLHSNHPMLYAEHLNKDIANLRIGQKCVLVTLDAGKGSIKVSDKPFCIVWEKIISYLPNDLHGYDQKEFIEILKEALSAFGGGYFQNTEICPNFIVQFNF